MILQPLDRQRFVQRRAVQLAHVFVVIVQWAKHEIAVRRTQIAEELLRNVAAVAVDDIHDQSGRTGCAVISRAVGIADDVTDHQRNEKEINPHAAIREENAQIVEGNIDNRLHDFPLRRSSGG